MQFKEILAGIGRNLKKALAFKATIPLLILLLTFIAYKIVMTSSNQPPIVDRVDISYRASEKILEIRGSHFGREQGGSYVRIGPADDSGKHRLSAYSEWSDERIRARLPQDASGFVYIVTPQGETQGGLLFDTERVPSIVPGAPGLGIPAISSMTPTKGSIGSIITLTGSNFGSSQGDSKVYFTWTGNPLSSIESQNDPTKRDQLAYLVSSAADNSGYQRWNDTQISLSVPDGASSGSVMVHTARGYSNSIYFELVDFAGQRQLREKKVYSLSYGAEITRLKSSGPNDLYLWVPRVLESPTQRNLKLTTQNITPMEEYFNGSLLYRLKDTPSDKDISITIQAVIEVYSNENSFKPWLFPAIVKAQANSNDPYLKPDKLVTSEDPLVVAKAAEIVGGEKNPYYAAKAIYDYLTHNFIPTGERIESLQRAIANGRADPLSFSALFCALTRASGIRAAPISGILVDSEQKTYRHVWAEFWLPGFGWVPVDPALGAGMAVGGFTPKEDPRQYYFGNLDNQHVAFMRGYHEYRQIDSRGKVASYKQALALQNIFEEMDGAIESYSSFWTDVRVIGVY